MAQLIPSTVRQIEISEGGHAPRQFVEPRFGVVHPSERVDSLGKRSIGRKNPVEGMRSPLEREPVLRRRFVLKQKTELTHTTHRIQLHRRHTGGMQIAALRHREIGNRDENLAGEHAVSPIGRMRRDGVSHQRRRFQRDLPFIGDNGSGCQRRIPGSDLWIDNRYDAVISGPHFKAESARRQIARKFYLVKQRGIRLEQYRLRPVHDPFAVGFFQNQRLALIPQPVYVSRGPCHRLQRCFRIERCLHAESHRHRFVFDSSRVEAGILFRATGR